MSTGPQIVNLAKKVPWKPEVKAKEPEVLLLDLFVKSGAGGAAADFSFGGSLAPPPPPAPAPAPAAPEIAVTAHATNDLDDAGAGVFGKVVIANTDDADEDGAAVPAPADGADPNADPDEVNELGLKNRCKQYCQD